MSLSIRSASPADIPALRDMLVETWHATYDTTLGVGKVDEIAATWHSIDKLTAELDEAEAHPAVNALLVATEAGRLVGSASVHRQADGPLELARLYIAPGRQGRGIGKALLAAAVARFPGARTARLEVEPRNAKAIAFYRQFGFDTVATGSACGGDTRAALEHLVMEAQLPLFLLRPARDSDAQDLFGLLSLCFAEYPGCYVDPHDDLPDLVKPGHWKERRGKDGQRLGGEFWVLEDARGRVCACVAVDYPETGEFSSEVASGSREENSTNSKTAELHRLYVRPDCRRRGIAARLVAHVEAAAREQSASRIVLWSDTRFSDAHRLYEKCGYLRHTSEPREVGDISRTWEYGFVKSLIGK